MRLPCVVLLSLLLFTSCKKPNLPVGLTNFIELQVITIDSLTYSSAKITGRLSTETIPFQAYGFCFDTLENSQNIIRSFDLKDNIFTLKISGLIPDSKYHLKAFLSYNDYVFYSKDTIFKTLPPTPPVVDIYKTPYITTNSINAKGSIIDNGGSPVTERGICWNTTGNPSLSDNVIKLAGGNGDFVAPVSGLQVYSTYYLRSYAKNKFGTTFSEQLRILTYGNGVKSDEGTMSDAEGNIYKTVKIGNQWWMAENFKCRFYSDGKTKIPLLSSDQEWWNNPFESAGYCWYSNDQLTYNKYGILYNKFTIRNTLKLCPAGWHVPSVEAWDSLNIYLGQNSTSTTYINKFKSIEWVPGTNTSGFSALPGGVRSSLGTFSGILQLAVFLTSTPEMFFYIGIDWYQVRNLEYPNVPYYSVGASLRCIKN